MKANPRHSYFLDVLTKHVSTLPVPWSGDCWRFQDADFPRSDQILSGHGAYLNGGRWNGIKQFPAVYGSTDEHTAIDESNARAKRYGIVVRKPRVVVAIHLQLQRVLDLTDAEVRRKLGITLKEIAAEDWEKLQDSGVESLSQALGRAAHESWAEAILVKSFARRSGVNVAFFPKNRLPISTVKIWDEGSLPRPA
jgi:RES domain-containing protein